MPLTTTHSHFGIYGYLKKDDAILLIKKARGPYKGMYDLPGGSPEENETNAETLLREIKEETGLDVTSYQKITDQVITTFYKYSLNGEDFLLRHSALFYSVEAYQGNIKTDSDGEDSDGAEWFKISDLHQIKCSPLVKLFL
jgi:8-oxo-dGTP diphosphatase